MHLSKILTLALSAALGTTHTVIDIDDSNKVVEFIGNESQMKAYMSKLGLNAGNIVAFGHNAMDLDTDADNSDICYHVIFTANSNIVDGKMTTVQMTDGYIDSAVKFKKSNEFDYAGYVAATVTTDGMVVYGIAHNSDTYDADSQLAQYADGFIATLLLDDTGIARNTLSATNVVLLVGDTGKRQVVLAADGKYAKLQPGFDVDFNDGFVLDGPNSGLIQVALGTANLSFVSADDLYEYVTQDKSIAWEQIQIMDGNIAIQQVSTTIGGSLILTGITNDGNTIGIPVKIENVQVKLDYARLITDMPLSLTRIAVIDDSNLVVMGQQPSSTGRLHFLRQDIDTNTEVDQGAQLTGLPGLSIWAQGANKSQQASLAS